MSEERFEKITDLAKHKKILAIFTALEERPTLKVDMSLMDEIVEAVSVAKEFRAKADAIRLPKRYKTEDDLHELAAFLAETQAKRDRCVEVKVEHMPLQNTLSKFWRNALGILFQYDLIANLSPAPKRDAMLDYVLAPLKDRIEQVEMIIKAASEADRNLGNAYFTIKELKAIGGN